MNSPKILLHPNFQRANTGRVLREAVEKLLGFGAHPMLSEQNLREAGELSGVLTGPEEELLADCDMLMSVGGDGTMLRAAHDAIRFDKPLIGVNSGRVGFLTQLEPTELDLLQRLVAGDYAVSGRMLLDVRIFDGEKTLCRTALNDIVARREDANHILSINISEKDGRLVMRQRADGVIFATPTGSTAYSLSAGGPVVSPELSATVLTPICPHGTFRCSLVLPPEKTYEVTETGGPDCGFAVSVDGAHQGVHHRIEVEKSRRGIRLIDLGVRDFYRNLGDKLVSV